MTEEMQALISYRLEQADEALHAAQLLLEQGSYRTVVNRAYYAMFYAILALLVPTKQQASRHAWVMTLFDRDFVKMGVFGKDFSLWLHDAFELRQRADYQEMVTISLEQATIMLEHARLFVAGVKTRVTQQLSAAETDTPGAED